MTEDGDMYLRREGFKDLECEIRIALLARQGGTVYCFRAFEILVEIRIAPRAHATETGWLVM